MKKLLAFDCTTDKTLHACWSHTDRAAIFLALRAAPDFLLALALKRGRWETCLPPLLVLDRWLEGENKDRRRGTSSDVQMLNRIGTRMEWKDRTHRRECSLNSPADPVCVFDRAGFAFVLQAATVEAALLSLTWPAWVVWEGAAATGLAMSPGLEGEKHSINTHINTTQKVVVKWSSDVKTFVYVQGFTHFWHDEQCFHSRPSWETHRKQEL